MTRLYVWGRMLTAGLGAAAAALAVVLGRRIGLGLPAALTAGLLVALAPHAVLHGRFLTVHTLSSTAGLVFLLALLGADEDPSDRSAAATGAAAGAFASCEYTGLVALPFAAVVLWRRGLRPAVIALAAGAGLWATLNPGACLDFGGWRAAQRSQAHAIALFSRGPADLAATLAPALGLLPLGAGTAGLLLLLARSGRHRLVAAWAFVYLAATWSLGNPFARRYAVLFPLLAVGAASLPRHGGRRAAATAMVLLVAAGAEAALRSAAVLAALERCDTRTIAVAWAEANVPAGASVGLENWFFAPHLDDERYTVALGRAETRPDWYVSTEFNWEDRSVLADAGYRLVQEVRRPHVVGPIAFRDSTWPEDMRYVNPTIRIWRRAVDVR